LEALVKIPFMRIDRQFAEIKSEVMPKVMHVLETGRVLQSPEIDELERELASLHGLAHAVATNSGTDALTVAIQALELPPGSAIAVPALTFIASASAIVHNRCRPVFIDVDPSTMLMDTEEVVRLVRRGAVQAVVAVHLYGQLLELGEIAKAAAEHGVPVLEDAAQALGSTRFGKPAGGHSRVTCLSFDPTKVIGACGSGGALLTDDPRIAQTARQLRYHGHAGNRVYERVGYNCQMDSVQAAILGVKLTHLTRWQARRSAIAEMYLRGLANSPGVRPLTTLTGNVHNHHKFVLEVPRRDALVAHLAERGVQTAVHYTIPLHRQPCFAEFSAGVSLPRVEKAVGDIVSLPMYAELTDAEVAHVIQATSEFYAG
jgi:dTDP-4-amino-4,6-dideoxygalactose transaminase